MQARTRKVPELQVVGDGDMGNWAGKIGRQPLRAQIEEIRFNNMGTYAAKLEIHPNICGGMQEVTVSWENHVESAGA